MRQRELANLRNQIHTEADALATQVEDDLRHRIPALERMAQRWELRGALPEEEFVNDALAYLFDTPGFQALEWADRDSIVRWVVPVEGNAQAVNLSLAFEPKRRAAISKARVTRAPAMSAAIDLVQGGKGFLVFIPTFVQGRFEGFVLAVFRIEAWLDYVFKTGASDVLRKYRVSVALDDVPVMKQSGWDQLAVADLDTIVETKFLDHRLSIHTRPTRVYVSENKTPLPTLTAGFGLLLSLLVTFITFLLQKAFTEAWKTRTAQLALNVEIVEHRKTTETLHQTLSRVELATKAGGIGIWAWDIATDALTWNERMYQLYDIPNDVTPTYRTWSSSIHRDDAPAAERLLKHAVEGRAVFDTEFRIVTSTGQVRHLGAAARVEREQDGNPLRVNGINWDITDLKRAEADLKRSEEQVRLLLNSTAEAIYGLDLVGNCTFANAACVKILGYPSPEQLLGKNMHDLIHHSRQDGRPLPAEECSIYRAFRERQGVHRDDEVLWRADGSSFLAEYWSFPQLVNGEVYGAVVTFLDVTARKLAEQMLATERQRLAYILEGTNVGTWEWNVQTGETVLNERWAEMVGYRLAELHPVSIETWTKLVHPDDAVVSESLLKRHFAGELAYYECEARMHHKNGSWIWVLDRGKVATWTDDGKPLTMSGTHLDITHRKVAEERIRHMATHDALTGLATLRLAKERLAMTLGMARRQRTLAAVMFIDLDGFKAVNDSLGHDAGDEVLREVAKRLTSSVRETDTVARVGGDEFLLIAGGLHTMENAMLVAEKLVGLVGQPIELRGQNLHIGASIGIAICPDHGAESDALIKLADEAMYRVKNSGKGGFGLALAPPGVQVSRNPSFPSD